MTLLISGCIDDKFEEEDSFQKEEIISDGLSFNLQLDQSFSTRAEDAIDNYIDYNKFRILFFDNEGNFLFEAKSWNKSENPDENGYTHITVSMSGINDGNGKSLIKEIRKKLKASDFKIAVLANWPSGDYLNWGWDNSALNPSPSSPKTINSLHHLESDSYYSQRSGTYGFLMDGDKMGKKVKWNTSTLNLDGREAAETWIRNNWDPETKTVTSIDNFKTSYQNLWQLWNFGGSFNDNIISYSSLWNDGTKDRSSAWKNRNGNKFYDLLNQDHDTEITETVEIDGLTLVPGTKRTSDSDKNIEKDAGPARVYNKDGLHGIILPITNYPIQIGTSSNYKINLSSEYTKGYIKFTAPATGKLRIKWGTVKGSGKIFVQRNSNYETNSGSRDLGGKYEDFSEKSDFAALSITGDAEDIYIFNRSSNDIVIYAIEYICDQYLYETDRVKIMPSEDMPIPMYGVQNFSAITDWTEGVVKDISYDASGNHNYIALIRSLAKVELYLPKEAKYIYMRSMNNQSRCEPVDVSTPTSITWKKTHDKSQSSDYCEWHDIQEYGAGYGKADNKFKEYFSWFYGTWSSWWKNEDGTTSKVTPPAGNSNYPHIFNPVIERTDYCEFSDAIDDGSYKKYVIYMPDKGIDDPNEEGKLTSAPKVAHIEFRYPEMCDGNENLDDNNCYRIYFTDYSTNPYIKTVSTKDFDSYYEKNLKFTGYDENGDAITTSEDHLTYHWPVMRNHVYQFHVTAAQDGTLTVKSTIRDWNYEKIEDTW